MTKKTFDVDYFIAKFEAIPEEFWCVEYYTHRDNLAVHCALGHCNEHHQALFDEVFYGKSEANSLRGLIDAPNINDGKDPMYTQSTPKARILAALKDVKERRSQ